MSSQWHNRNDDQPSTPLHIHTAVNVIRLDGRSCQRTMVSEIKGRSWRSCKGRIMHDASIGDLYFTASQSTIRPCLHVNMDINA